MFEEDGEVLRISQEADILMVAYMKNRTDVNKRALEEKQQELNAVAEKKLAEAR